MNCPLCGYSMTAFDSECPRCHGQGLRKDTTPLPAAPASPAAGVSPQQPVPVYPPPPVQPTVQLPAPSRSAAPHPGGTNPVYPTAAAPVAGLGAGMTAPPGGQFESASLSRTEYLFVAGSLIFCLGYLAPWMSIPFLGTSINTGGQLGLEFVFFITAALVAAMCVVGKSRGEPLISPRVTAALSMACLAFAAGEFLYLALLLNFSFLGVGLVLMLVGAGIMSYFSALQILAPVRPAFVGGGGILVLAVVLWAGYRGHEIRRNPLPNILLPNIPDPTGLVLPGASGLSPGSPVVNTRSDLEVQINSSRTMTTLVPLRNFESPPPLAPGKTYLICNVTVTYKGTRSSLLVSHSDFRLTASDQQQYFSQAVEPTYQGLSLLVAMLSPGGSATGDLVFVVDAGANPEKIEPVEFSMAP